MHDSIELDVEGCCVRLRWRRGTVEYSSGIVKKDCGTFRWASCLEGQICILLYDDLYKIIEYVTFIFPSV